MITIREVMVAVVIAALVGAAMWFYHQGKSGEALKEAVANNQKLIATQKKVKELENIRDQQEHDHSVEVAAIDQIHQKELSDARAQSGQFIDDVMSGKLRLYDAHARCGRPDRNPAGGTPDSSSVDNGETGAELSEEVERFLELEAARADEVVIQLSACQAILTDDRKNANHSR